MELTKEVIKLTEIIDNIRSLQNQVIYDILGEEKAAQLNGDLEKALKRLLEINKEVMISNAEYYIDVI